MSMIYRNGRESEVCWLIDINHFLIKLNVLQNIIQTLCLIYDPRSQWFLKLDRGKRYETILSVKKKSNTNYMKLSNFFNSNQI